MPSKPQLSQSTTIPNISHCSPADLINLINGNQKIGIPKVMKLSDQFLHDTGRLRLVKMQLKLWACLRAPAWDTSASPEKNSGSSWIKIEDSICFPTDIIEIHRKKTGEISTASGAFWNDVSHRRFHRLRESWLTCFRLADRKQMGVSENSVPHCTQWFCWSLSLWKMASYHWEY